MSLRASEKRVSVPAARTFSPQLLFTRRRKWLVPSALAVIGFRLLRKRFHNWNPHPEENSSPASRKEAPRSPNLRSEQYKARKRKLLTQAHASLSKHISNAVIIKDENVFLATDPDGTIPFEKHGLGIYYHDCRYLNGYEIRMEGNALVPIAATAEHAASAAFQLTNPDLLTSSGKPIKRYSIGVKWRHELEREHPGLVDTFVIRNFNHEAIEFSLSFQFRSQFDDIFTVRKILDETPSGTLHPARWDNDLLVFSYDGLDDKHRMLSVRFPGIPLKRKETGVDIPIRLEGRSSMELTITVSLDERSPGKAVRRPALVAERAARVTPEVRSDSTLLSQIMERSFHDLRLLRGNIQGDEYYCAGLPWFGTLFGRDSIITAIQMLAFEPTIAETTLRILAKYQGTKVNDWTDEEPGKILHEIRSGELSNIGAIPQTPYYGTVDATPLFLILAAQHCLSTGTFKILNELRKNIDAAIRWIDEWGDRDGDGYIDYMSDDSNGTLINQGWKDSGNGMPKEDGGMPLPPIAPVEAQGYVYFAKHLMAKVFGLLGDQALSTRLRHEAERLKLRFNRDFWLTDKTFFALALQHDGIPLKVISSNPGHALWSGIVDPDKAAATIPRLMAHDMFNGWGIRTLSEREVGYHPLGYHLGTIWPHDNAIIAAGFKSYGYDSEALTLFEGLIAAALNFEHYRLPEAIAGFSRDEYKSPVRYPSACHPQAWSSGSMPLMLQLNLGIQPDGFQNKLYVTRPMLPELSDFIEFRGLPVSSSRVDLRFERGDKTAKVRILRNPDNVDIEVQQ